MLKQIRHFTLLSGAFTGAFLASGAINAEEIKYPPKLETELYEPSLPRNFNRIVGGTPAPVGAHPWQVALLSSQERFFCGGSVIAPNWVLTAAHCVDSEPFNLRVLVGTNSLSVGGRRIAVSGVIIHPQWRAASNVARSDYDVALLRLSEPANVQAVRLLPQAPWAASLQQPGLRATITGWGRTSEGGSTVTLLRQAIVPLVSNASCATSYGQSQITARMICAGFQNGGVDTCQGDSGGPMVVRSGGTTYQIGITSFGRGCARPGFPGVYARVSALYPWIMASISGQANCYAPGLRPQIRTPADFTCLQLARNDDFSAGPAAIGFPIRIGSRTFTQLYVNNNGNLTFDGPRRTYTPTALGNLGYPIIAPFFADVDTRNPASRIVYYGTATISGRRAFMALWQDVGYFPQRVDKRNTFQVILIENGRNSGNFTVEFNYSKIQFETGGASGGINGLGGTPARAGIGVARGQPAIELRGSGVTRAFLDSGPAATRLITVRRNTSQPGRAVFSFTNGTVR